jgi:hypothetical protein
MPHRIPVPIVNKELSQQGGSEGGKGLDGAKKTQSILKDKIGCNILQALMNSLQNQRE